MIKYLEGIGNRDKNDCICTQGRHADAGRNYLRPDLFESAEECDNSSCFNPKRSLKILLNQYVQLCIL